jgi:aspartate/methionine/tyrosine aminotransferase
MMHNYGHCTRDGQPLGAPGTRDGTGKTSLSSNQTSRMSQPRAVDSLSPISPIKEDGPWQGLYKDLSSSLPRSRPWLSDKSTMACSGVATLSRDTSPNTKLPLTTTKEREPTLEDLCTLSCCLYEGVSSRAACNLADCWLLSEGMQKLALNPYNPETNTGIINAGSAENRLMLQELLERCNRPGTTQVDPSMLFYGCYFGSEALRTNTAKLINKYFKPSQDLLPTNVVALAGCAASISALVQVVCDQGEAVLLPCPFFGGFQPQMEYQARAVPYPVHCSSEDGFKLTLESLQDAIITARRDGLVVRACLLCHPHNPFGTLYTREELIMVMTFCKRENLHLIVDEIYALSTFKGEFVSSLSINVKDVPGGFDPTRLHVVYGMSKDFCMNGLRVGFCFSRSPRVLGALHKVAFFHNCSSLVDSTISRILADAAFLDDFIATNQKRLGETYGVLEEFCESEGIGFMEAQAGFFVYLDLRKWVNLVNASMTDSVDHPHHNHEHNHEDRRAERFLWNRFLEKGVYIAPGEAFHTHELGWFRLCFANSDWNEDVTKRHVVLREALGRIRGVLDAIEKEYRD